VLFGSIIGTWPRALGKSQPVVLELWVGARCAPWHSQYFQCIGNLVRKQEKNIHKKSRRGRPPGTRFAGNTPVRLEPSIQDAVDAWAERHAVNRSEALRRLVALGLGASQPRKFRSAKARSTARELASAQLDKLIDPSAPDEEKQRRKRRLLKGPKEFRDMRALAHSKPKS
jgi:hypothetical protein